MYLDLDLDQITFLSQILSDYELRQKQFGFLSRSEEYLLITIEKKVDNILSF